MRISSYLLHAAGCVLLITLLAAPSARAAVPELERQILVDLYDATNGDAWTRSDGWLGAPGSECSWYGVHCDETESTIRELTLEGNRLAGTIPSSIGQLTGLVELFLYENQLTGPIPPELGQITSLQRLDLSRNQLTGSIPASLGNLTQLTELYLQMNQLSGTIPPELGQLTNVAEFGLWINLLTGSIPSELGQLNSVEFLVLGANPLTGPIPPEFGQLSNLTRLYLGDSGISGSIPAELGQLTNLQLLHLGQTDLSGRIPSELGQLTNLVGLNLGRSRLSGPVPSSLMNLTSLPDAVDANPPFFALDLTYAALYVTDPALDAFLDSKHQEGNWSATQTIAPADVRVSSTSATSVTLAWTPIEYSLHPGAYDIFVSTSASGEFQPVASTSDKTASQITIEGLAPDTTWYFKVRAATDPHPPNNVHRVESEFSPVVSATTSAGEPVVVLTRSPNVMVQQANAAGATTSFALENTGQGTATIAILMEGSDFYEQEPSSFALDAGGTQVVTISGLARPAGLYEGTSVVSGSGTDGLRIPVRLLSQEPPQDGIPLVVTRTPRIDLATSGSETVTGTATLENIGSATATGLVESDQPWVSLPTDAVVIEPQETANIDFTIDLTDVPRESFESGELGAVLAFIYLDSASESSGGKSASQSGSGSVSVTTSTLRITQVIGSQPTSIPPLGEDEVALFIAGAGRGAVGTLGFLTELSLFNFDGARSLEGVELYYQPAETGATTAKGTTSAIASVSSVTLADSFAALGVENGSGALVVRSAEIDRLGVSASWIAKNDAVGSVARTWLPVFRSDLARRAGETFTLAGLDTESSHTTEIYIQEALGIETTVIVDFRDENGSVLDSQTIGIGPFELEHLATGNEIPSGTVLATVTTATGGGVVGYATTKHPATGAMWVTVDWTVMYESGSVSNWTIPIVGNVGSMSGRRRPVHSESTLSGLDVNRVSELTMVGTGSEPTRVELAYRPRGKRFRTSAALTLQPYRSYRFDDVVSDLFGRARDFGGAIEVETEAAASVTVNIRSLALVTGVPRTTIPVMPATEALGVGEIVTFFGIEDSDRRSITAGTPGSVRTSLGLLELGDGTATVKVSVYFTIPGSLAAAVNAPPVGTRTIVLGPGEIHDARDVVEAILGPVRNDAYGYLRGVRIDVEVLSGDGKVLPFRWSVDNASGQLIAPAD